MLPTTDAWSGKPGGISAGDGRYVRLDMFWRPLAALLSHWQLEHRNILPRAKLGHKYMASVRKLDRVMMALAHMRIDRVELADAITDGLSPEPAVAIFYLFGEGQFGSRKHADRYIGRAL